MCFDRSIDGRGMNFVYAQGPSPGFGILLVHAMKEQHQQHARSSKATMDSPSSRPLLY